MTASDARAPVFDHRAPGTPETAWVAAEGWSEAAEVRLPERCEHLLVLAAHPDDDVLGAAGAIALAADSGRRVSVLIATDGEASHPDSPSHPPAALAAVRNREAREALALLAPSARVVQLGLPDSALRHHHDALVEALVDLIGRDGARTLLLGPWEADGHTDHEAAGRAARVAAWRTDAEVWAFPIWWWAWASPRDVTTSGAAWADLRRLPLPDAVRRRKADALARHVSQVRPLSDAPGDEALLGPSFLQHFARPWETFVPVEADPRSPFEPLHREEPDPWQVRSSWYEARKRAVTLGALPRERYRRGVEVGASVGALAQDLADRCDALVALEESAAAATAAEESTRDLAHVRVQRCRVPEEWVEGHVDLVVVSELGYFLSPAALDGLAERIVASVEPGGDLLACHWRHDIRGWPLDAEALHARFAALGWRRLVRHVEDDFLLEVWRRDD